MWGDQDLINIYFHFHPGKSVQSSPLNNQSQMFILWLKESPQLVSLLIRRKCICLALWVECEVRPLCWSGWSLWISQDERSFPGARQPTDFSQHYATGVQGALLCIEGCESIKQNYLRNPKQSGTDPGEPLGLSTIYHPDCARQAQKIFRCWTSKLKLGLSMGRGSSPHPWPGLSVFASAGVFDVCLCPFQHPIGAPVKDMLKTAEERLTFKSKCENVLLFSLQQAVEKASAGTLYSPWNDGLIVSVQHDVPVNRQSERWTFWKRLCRLRKCPDTSKKCESQALSWIHPHCRTERWTETHFCRVVECVFLLSSVSVVLETETKAKGPTRRFAMVQPLPQRI